MREWGRGKNIFSYTTKYVCEHTHLSAHNLYLLSISAFRYLFSSYGTKHFYLNYIYIHTKCKRVAVSFPSFLFPEANKNWSGFGVACIIKGHAISWEMLYRLQPFTRTRQWKTNSDCSTCDCQCDCNLMTWQSGSWQDSGISVKMVRRGEEKHRNEENNG